MDIIDAAINSGAGIDAKDNDGATALVLAVKTPKPSTITKQIIDKFPKGVFELRKHRYFDVSVLPKGGVRVESSLTGGWEPPSSSNIRTKSVAMSSDLGL